MPHVGEHLHDGSESPAEFNWVTAGAVNPIKDQGQLASLSSRFLTAPPPSVVARVEACPVPSSMSLAQTWPLRQATHTRLPMALASLFSR